MFKDDTLNLKKKTNIFVKSFTRCSRSIPRWQVEYLIGPFLESRANKVFGAVSCLETLIQESCLEVNYHYINEMR